MGKIAVPKQLLPLWGKPVLAWTLESMLEMGVECVTLVTNVGECEKFEEALEPWTTNLHVDVIPQWGKMGECGALFAARQHDCIDESERFIACWSDFAMKPIDLHKAWCQNWIGVREIDFDKESRFTKLQVTDDGKVFLGLGRYIHKGVAAIEDAGLFWQLLDAAHENNRLVDSLKLPHVALAMSALGCRFSTICVDMVDTGTKEEYEAAIACGPEAWRA